MRLYFKKKTHKTKLMNAFNIAGLYYSTKRNGKTLFQFPRVLDVRFKEDKTTYVFKLPHGVDPKEVAKKEFVFRSMFGELIEFKGTNTISFTVYNEVHNGSFSYSFEELQSVMKKHNLPIIAGKDINGKFYCYDMTSNPHLLIAGETGSGKSVMLRAVLTSLIQHCRTGLQLHLADLKRSEFHLFRNVDIVKSVLTDKKDVEKSVNWFHKQLQKRGDILDAHELSHIDEYNKLDGVEKEDYLVLCIDEFSILRDMTDTMEQLIDISALGRALGIYLILSTQRPDRKIIDGLMKANLTVRYAFRHADKLNSRITLGEGAKADASQIDEEDKGKFFMRFSGCHYLQSPYLTTEKAKELLEEYKVPFEKRPHSDPPASSGNVIEYKGEVTESDIYEELPKETEPEDLSEFMIEGGDQ
jgi:DNA segregation ATPase FtsK/SpoIIIE, S-DNA-T family